MEKILNIKIQKVLIITILLALFYIQPAYGSLSGWSYRRPITLTENSGQTLTNYQVLITIDTASLISAGKMRSDCADIRFTDSDGTTLLNHWLESGCNSANTKVWVKVPSIPASSTKTIYIYYGNPSAGSTSSSGNTFDFFDDFEPDSDRWTGSGVTTIYSGSGGYDYGTEHNGWVYAWVSGHYASAASWLISDVIGSGNFKAGLRIKTSGQRGSNYACFCHMVSQINDSGQTTIDGCYCSTNPYPNWTEKVYSLTGNNVKLKIYVGVTNSGDYPTTWAKLEVDDVRVRKYVSPEPTYTIGSEIRCFSDLDCSDGNDCTQDICNNPGLASASCSNIPYCAGTMASCGCGPSCDNCDDKDGWYNAGSSYSCCKPYTEESCSCQDQQLRNYNNCLNYICTYSVINTQTIYPSCDDCNRYDGWATSTLKNNGTIYGASWSASTPTGQGYCLQFDGTDDYVSIPDSNILDLTSSLTLEAWAKWAEAPSNWFDDNWQYRKPISVSGSSSSQTNYQVLAIIDTLILISQGKMRNDCADIRFTASDKTTQIPYWLESGCNTTSTKLWVKVPSLPTSGATIYIYYGNASTSSTSNGTNTFEFFDDFEYTGAPDSSKWTENSGGGAGYMATHTVENGAYHTVQPSAANRGAEIVSRDSWNSGRVICNYEVISKSGNHMEIIYIENKGIVLSYYWNGTSGCGNNTGNWRIEGVWNGASGSFDADHMSGGDYCTASWSSGGTTPAHVKNYNRTGDNGTHKAKLYWIAVGKYVSPEPSAAAPGSEEERPKEKIILKKGDAYSLYMSEDGSQIFGSINGNWLTAPVSQPNQWHHFVLTYNGSSRALYIDGQQAATSTFSQVINTNTDSLIIGEYFRGSIDEVRLYKRALTSQGVNEHYQGTFGDETGLVGLWHLDEGEGLTCQETISQGCLGDNLCSFQRKENRDYYCGSSCDYNVTGIETQSSPCPSAGPTASITCNPGLGCDTVGCVAYQNCNFSFINNSSDPNGRGDIVRSEWDIYGYGNDPDEPFSGSNALNPFYLPTMPAVPSGTYTVELYIEDFTGLSSATTTTVQVKRDVSADFMCSRDNIQWTDCRTFYTRIHEGQKIYFKDISSPSEGASIDSRTWEIGLPGSGNQFGLDEPENPNLRFTGNTQISLTVEDDAGREASKSYIVNVMIYSHMRYEEAKPLPL